MHQDTIEVRPDETFDEARLADYLRGRLDGSEQSLVVRQFGGGLANLTYLLDYGSHEYVLRRPPLGPVARAAHDMGREYRVLSVLHRVYPLAPRAFLYCDDDSVIGAPFIVAERKRGLVVRTQMPKQFADTPGAARRIGFALADALADLHAVDYRALGLEGLGRPKGFIERQIEGWYKRWHAARPADSPLMEELYAWLRENKPTSESHSLVHNDFKLDNVMLAADDPGQLVAVFDWDMCTLGNPLNDLGALLCYWTERTDPDWMQGMVMVPLGVDFPSREELTARYAKRSGRDVSNIRFYHVLGLFRLAGIIAQIYIRYVRGQTQDQRFAGLGRRIPLIIRAAHELASR
ncbi:MAG: phosphotransferase family protein [Anaerolineales bacterium]